MSMEGGKERLQPMWQQYMSVKSPFGSRMAYRCRCCAPQPCSCSHTQGSAGTRHAIHINVSQANLCGVVAASKRKLDWSFACHDRVQTRRIGCGHGMG